MKYRVQVLCRPVLAPGFALAGLRPVTAATPSEAASALRNLLAQPDTGVVLVDESLHDQLPPELRRDLARRALPLVVPCPAPRWQGEEAGIDRYIAELLRQAIGYRVRLT
jgi:vacuolar-type H+-ATPase subunit F/Vma7